jgi:hypothetical protein
MRKQLALAGVLVAGLTAPIALAGQNKDFEGTIENGGTLSFKLKKTDNGKKVVKFTFIGMPADCKSGLESVSGEITFAIKVKSNKFDAKAVSGNPNNPNATLKVTGKIDKSNAEGTLRVSGPNVLVDPGQDGVRRECDTGKENWLAGKV